MSASHVQVGDDSVWPRAGGDRMESLEWALRYGEPSRQDMLLAASVLAAYRQMVLVDTEKRRVEVVRALRAAEATCALTD